MREEEYQMMPEDLKEGFKALWGSPFCRGMILTILALLAFFIFLISQVESDASSSEGALGKKCKLTSEGKEK